MGAHILVRGEDRHGEDPGVSADVEEDVRVGAECDHEVKGERVFGFGAPAFPPVELLGDLAAEGFDEDEVRSACSAADFGEFDGSREAADPQTSDPGRDRSQQRMERRLGEGGFDRQLEAEPGLSARGESAQVIVHDGGPLADRKTFPHTINARPAAPGLPT